MERLPLSDDVLANLLIIDRENNYFTAIDFKQEQPLMTSEGKQFITLGFTANVFKDLSMYHLIVRNEAHDRVETTRVTTLGELVARLKHELALQVFFGDKAL